jgi:hypothetical protein
LKSEDLKIENEDFLFHLILSFIKEDPNQKSLLNFVQFSFISSELIQEYFLNFSIDELDFELFEALKSRLYRDAFGKETDPCIHRWRNQTKLIAKQGNESISKENSEMKSTIKEKEKENSEIKNTIKQKEQENSELKITIQQNESEIIKLKKYSTLFALT